MNVREVISVETRAVDTKKTAGAAIGGGLMIGALVAVATVVAIMSALGGN
jgi:hypothetical protein